MLPDTTTRLKRVTQLREGERNDGADFVGNPEYFKMMADTIDAMAEEHPAFWSPPITPDELTRARLAPDCIVSNLYYADVGLMIAPGGVGKTTLEMFIAAHIVLGRRVLGEAVEKPGPVLFITAEDSREILVARLRVVMQAMGLDDAERTIVMNGIRIADVSGIGFKLTLVDNDVVILSGHVNEIIDACAAFHPVLIVIDPAVSFGVGESRVNDAEQGLIEAARKLRNSLNCAVIYIHHTGKANAREKTLDQYSGRNGSAFADGSRMVHVLQKLTPAEWQEATGETLADDETGLILARPKMSYCRPVRGLYIRRKGYVFTRVEPASTSKSAKTESNANQIHQFLTHELAQGRYHTKNSIDLVGAGTMSRSEKRAALSSLEVSGRVEVRERPNAGQRGARQYLHPVVSPDASGEAR